MEYTYQGYVRYAYGFDNPNHAAALICMILPLLWMARSLLSARDRLTNRLLWWGVLMVELLMYVALILTYSRSGFFVLIICGICFIYLSQKRKGRLLARWGIRYFFTAACVGLLGLVAFIVGAGERYFSWMAHPDGSVLNRFKIWQGACQLIYDNPLGTQQGYSGWLWSTFLYEGEKSIAFRTCMSSFLTLAVECGLVVFCFVLVWVMASLIGTLRVVYVGTVAWKRYVGMGLFCSLLSVLLSANLSTPFELGMLDLDFGESVERGRMASFIFFLLYIILMLLALFFFFSRWWLKLLAVSCLFSLLVAVALYFIGGYARESRIDFNYPHITLYKNHYHYHDIYVIADQHKDFKAIHNYLKQEYPQDRYIFSLSSTINIPHHCKLMLLSGDMASFPPHLASDCHVIIYFPTLPPPKNFPYKISRMELYPEHNNGFSFLWEKMRSE